MSAMNCCLMLITCALFHIGSASGIKCSCTDDGDRTICTIAQESRISDEHGCVYSWSNADSVLANEAKKHPELVESSSINELVTSKHEDEIVFSRHCPSEKPGEPVNCTEVPPVPVKSEVLTDPTTPSGSASTNKPERGEDYTKKVTIGVAVSIILVSCIIAGVLYRKRRRIRSYIWAPVPKDEDPKAAVDLENGNPVEQRSS